MTVPLSFRDSIELIDAIWGPYGSDISLRDKRLKALIGNSWAQQITPRDGYFTVVAHEISRTPGQNETPILSLKVLAKLVRVLKSNPQVLRQDLEFNEDVRRVLQDEMLDRTLSIMLMTESTFSGTSHQAIFNPRWRMNESLEAFIQRVYENPQDHCDDYSPIQTTKLSVAYFRRRHVQVEISWTEFGRITWPYQITTKRCMSLSILDFCRQAWILHHQSKDATALHHHFEGTTKITIFHH